VSGRSANALALLQTALSKLIRRFASHRSTAFSRRITPDRVLNVTGDLHGSAINENVRTLDGVFDLWDCEERQDLSRFKRPAHAAGTRAADCVVVPAIGFKMPGPWMIGSRILDARPNKRASIVALRRKPIVQGSKKTKDSVFRVDRMRLERKV
jgi:hypothetical protein